LRPDEGTQDLQTQAFIELNDRIGFGLDPINSASGFLSIFDFFLQV